MSSAGAGCGLQTRRRVALAAVRFGLCGGAPGGCGCVLCAHCFLLLLVILASPSPVLIFSAAGRPHTNTQVHSKERTTRRRRESCVVVLAIAALLMHKTFRARSPHVRTKSNQNSTGLRRTHHPSQLPLNPHESPSYSTPLAPRLPPAHTRWALSLPCAAGALCGASAHPEYTPAWRQDRTQSHAAHMMSNCLGHLWTAVPDEKNLQHYRFVH
jgi:hypothetical protein